MIISSRDEYTIPLCTNVIKLSFFIHVLNAFNKSVMIMCADAQACHLH